VVPALAALAAVPLVGAAAYAAEPGIRGAIEGLFGVDTGPYFDRKPYLSDFGIDFEFSAAEVVSPILLIGRGVNNATKEAEAFSEALETTMRLTHLPSLMGANVERPDYTGRLWNVGVHEQDISASKRYAERSLSRLMERETTRGSWSAVGKVISDKFDEKFGGSSR